MNKIIDFFNSLLKKWRDMSIGRKVAIILIATGVLTGIIMISSYVNKASYAVLFSNLDPQDSGRIIEKLKSENIKYKVNDNTILVPKDKAAEIRMEVALDTSYQIKGYEIFDESKFGVTDTEAKIMYKRALEGELARTIKSMDEVENARVHLAIPDDSVFVRETEKATASVIIKPRGLKTLTAEQVKAVIALVSGSVKDLPKENIQILDTYGNLLSENLFDDAQGGTVSTSKQHEFEKLFEKRLESDIKQMLEAVFGQGKIAIKVNSDLNFDSKEITTIRYDKENVVEISSRIIEEKSKDNSGGGDTTGLDAQFGDDSYEFTDDSATGSSYEKKDETVNSEVGKTQENVIKAPGEVTRITVSVIIDSDRFEDVEKNEVKNIVAAAIGYDEKRGDTINISAMPFNTERQDIAKKEMELMEKAAKKEKLIRTIIYSVFGTLFIIIFIILIAKLSKRKNRDEKPSLDVVVGDKGGIIPKQPIAYEPVLEEDDDKMSFEKEIQNYANKKPDQVVEVIRTWLSEDDSR